MPDISQYRKFVVAIVAAAVTVAHAFGVPGAEDISVQVIAIFDALAAITVYLVPNEPSA